MTAAEPSGEILAPWISVVLRYSSSVMIGLLDWARSWHERRIARAMKGRVLRVLGRVRNQMRESFMSGSLILLDNACLHFTSFKRKTPEESCSPGAGYSWIAVRSRSEARIAYGGSCFAPGASTHRLRVNRQSVRNSGCWCQIG